jgi:hypothetical protein
MVRSLGWASSADGAATLGASDMKIVVVGGTGRLGSQVVAELQRRGHEAAAAHQARALTPFPVLGWSKA